MASAARSVSSRSWVTSPMIRMPRPGPGERLPPDDRLGQPELGADPAHLVLEQRPQRLDQLELEVVRQAADVVVALDRGRAGAAAGLDDVRVERALHEEADARSLRGDLGRRGLEHPDELPADDLALGLGVGDARERGEEPVGGVDGVQARARGGHEVALHLRALARPQQPVVDEHAGQPIADGPLDERGRHRGVDAAGQPADRPPVADLGAHGLDRLVDDRRGGPARPGCPRPRAGSARSTCWPCGEWPTSGWYCTPASRRSTSSNAATAARSDAAVTANPSGARTTESPWLIQTGCRAGSPSCSTPPSTRSSVRPYSRVPSCATSPPSASAMAWKP